MSVDAATSSRAAALLVVIFVLGAGCWLDALDLTDDVALAQAALFEQQGVEPENVREYFPSLFPDTPSVPLFASVVDPLQIYPWLAAEWCGTHFYHCPLYQSLCTYRI